MANFDFYVKNKQQLRGCQEFHDFSEPEELEEPPLIEVEVLEKPNNFLLDCFISITCLQHLKPYKSLA